MGEQQTDDIVLLPANYEQTKLPLQAGQEIGPPADQLSLRALPTYPLACGPKTARVGYRFAPFSTGRAAKGANNRTR